MPRHKTKRPYFRQKPILYFDENFPTRAVDAVKDSRKLTKYFKILSVYDFNNETRDDQFQYEFAKENGFTLVPLDRDFMNDRKFPISKMPGIIIILAGKNEISRIVKCLDIIVSFLASFPFPKSFIGDSKFQVSLEGCVMRGRDAKTRQLRTVTISLDDTTREVAESFSLFWIKPTRLVSTMSRGILN